MGINTVIAEARALIQDKIDRERERGRNRTLKIMMVGIPNVGKSSLINRLIGKASTKTGDKPGVTRGKQWLRIKGDAELLDTPGILPPKFEDQTVAVKLAYTGAIKDEIMNTELLAYSLCDYLRDNYPNELCTRYKLDTVEGLKGYEVLEKIGKKRGFVISGGEIDMERIKNVPLKICFQKKNALFLKGRLIFKLHYLMINLSSSSINLSQSSECTSTLIGLDKSKLKIPMIDFASTTYLPDVKSTSKSYLLTIFTKSFTSLIELSNKSNVFIILFLLISCVKPICDM